MTAEARQPCFICGSRVWQEAFRKNGKTFLKCPGCRLVRVRPLPSPDELREYYGHEYALPTGMGAALAAEEEMASVTARSRLAVVRRHALGELWLDVGCGTGVFLSELRKAGLNGEGLDLSESAVQQARQRRLMAHSTTVESFVPASPIDVVTAFDVIEHVLDPVSFLENARRLVRAGGRLALTTPDTTSLICSIMGRRWYFYIPEQHLFYFNRYNLQKLLARLHFEVVHVSRARKALTFDYSLLQLQAFNPVVARFGKALSVLIPAPWRRRPVRLYIGEMMVIAQRTG